MLTKTLKKTNAPLHGILFDLDGTLLDTAPDLLNALNHVLVNEGLQAMQLTQIRHLVSHGSQAMLEAIFGNQQTEQEKQHRQQQLIKHYEENIYVDTVFFDGMSDFLSQLDSLGLPWGVVTNKPAFLTDRLMQAVGLDQRASSIISGDTLSVSKPHPLPLLSAARQCGILPKHCVYIGDAERDIQAANAAGMISVVAAYGYLSDHDTPDTWQADYHIDHPSELHQFL